MHSTTRKLLFALPVALVFSSIALAQTSAIEGDVTAADGKKLANAEIKIERTDITQSFKTKTNKKGHYYYGGLGFPGTYDVSVEVDGKPVDGVKGVKPNGGVPAEINFDLRKAAAAQAAAQAVATGQAPAGQAPEEVEKGMTPEQKAAYEKNKKAAEEKLAKNKALNDSFNNGVDAETAKNYDAAIENFEKASTLDPTQHVVWSHLADNYSNRSDKDPADQKQADLQKAVDDYKKAIDLSPNNAAYHNNYALVLVKAGKMDEAKEELSKAATIDPPSAGKYYYNLGAVMANHGQNDAAAEAFQKAMAANYTEAYYQYGLVLVSKATTQGDKIVAPDGTVEAFQKYLQLAPTGPNAENAKGMLQTLGAGIQTNFKAPGSDKSDKTSKKKK